MKQDPFGNLNDWGEVLDLFDELADSGRLSDCQAGLVRILRYKGNWRLREEVLKRAGEIQVPSEELIQQVLAMLADDNIYYDLRVIAADTLAILLQNAHADSSDDLKTAARSTASKLKTTPQPPFFDNALNRLCADIAMPQLQRP